MDWDTYYERYSDWAESTQISRISSLTDFGPPDEIIEVIESLYNDKAATRLLNKALSQDVAFTPEQIIRITACLDTVPEDLIYSCETKFTRAQLEELFDYGIDENILRDAAKRSRVVFSPDIADEAEESEEDAEDPEQDDACDDFEEPEPVPAAKMPRIGFFTALFGLHTLFGRKNHTHSGRCNGDCANCPAHYGYRYGRWYYGHHHTEGCEFGGNSGKGGPL